MEEKLRKAIDFYIDKTNINEILLQCNFYEVNNIDKLKEKMYEYYSEKYTEQELEERVIQLFYE